MGVTQIFFFVWLITFCLTLICFQILGDIFKFDYSNFATDASAIKNKAASGPAISFPPIADCNSAYALSNTNVCIRSRAGLYVNRGITFSGDLYLTRSLDPFDSYFQDHETNSIAARIFVNPYTFIGTPVKHVLILLSFYNINFGILTSYTLGAPGEQGVRLYLRVYIQNIFDYYETSTFLITSASWVDVIVKFKYNRNAVANIHMSEKAYSSGWNDALPQINTDENCFDHEIADEAYRTTINILNFHYTDFTIQYLS